MRFIISLVFLLGISLAGIAQQKGTLKGTLKDEQGRPIPYASVAIMGTTNGVQTDSLGRYSITVPSKEMVKLAFSHIRFDGQSYEVEVEPGQVRTLDRILKVKDNIVDEVVINDESNRKNTMQRIDPKMALIIPTAGGGIEALLKTLPGVSSNNELSSQYNVRGGNYDENLIYVNDVEIYRPFLVRSGQQEGLTFINPDLVEGLSFSAGGFEAKYGDKLSSVLDVKYKRPRKFAATASGSLLGGGLHLEGATKDYKFSYLMGMRYRSNSYILGSLDTDGQYKPQFWDVQALLNYELNDKWNFSVLAHYSQNKYQFIPENRETDFGTISEALRLTVYFDGQEVNTFETMTGALMAEYRPTQKLRYKLIASAYRSNESETFDVQGQYWLGQLDNNFGSDNLGEVAFNRGIGTFLDHARNYLTANVASLNHIGHWLDGYRKLDWGLKYQFEDITDRLSEWNMIDSSGYSLPLNPNELQVFNVLKTDIKLQSNRVSGFLQNSWFFSDSSKHTLTAGVRFHYWDVNKEFIATPRATYAFNPKWKRDVVFRLSGGLYYQPPFYRELRDLNGVLNTNLKAQQSYHAVIGSDWNFSAWGRPFKLVAEVYYKYLDNIVPYEIDNVRIRYYATNNARGYATGLDLKINGEFVPGIESWASMSVMTVQEDIKDDFYYNYYNSDGEQIRFGITENNVVVDSTRVEPGYIPRPTDQRVNFSLFFQDYVPRLPMFKMHLNLVLGTGMPFGPPTYDRYKDTLRIPPYRRVDIGFSYMIKGEKRTYPKKNPLHYLKSLWVSMEVFNLLGTNNTLSYLWISDISNRQYAVPNYLTSRQLNVKLVAKF
jgi:hypothetical protein